MCHEIKLPRKFDRRSSGVLPLGRAQLIDITSGLFFRPARRRGRLCKRRKEDAASTAADPSRGFMPDHGGPSGFIPGESCMRRGLGIAREFLENFCTCCRISDLFVGVADIQSNGPPILPTAHGAWCRLMVTGSQRNLRVEAAIPSQGSPTMHHYPAQRPRC